jgi:tetratricopeptide (TPR) repeat protein
MGKILIAGRRSKMVAFVAILALTTFGALATASAQPADIKAIDKAFQDHYARGNYPAAHTDAQELERLVKARFGADHPYYAVALNQLGRVAQAQGKYGEAEAFFERALAIREKALGANHSDVGQTLNNLANLYRAQGKYSEAEGLYKRALAIREKALGANHSDVGQTLNNLARVYRDQGNYGEAERLFNRALTIREQTLGPSHPDVAATRSDLSAVLSEQGRSEKEEAKAEGVTPATAQALHSRGLAAWREGKYSEAEGLYKRALARVLVCEATEPTKRRALRRADCALC